MSTFIRLNRSRDCHHCGQRKYRILVSSPKADDPDFKIAVCPKCDMTTGKDALRDR